MSKRVAENYLTDQNWDKEDDKAEEPGIFAAASEDVIKQRPILKAKRRCTPSTEASEGNAFKGFGGFTGGANAGQSSSTTMTSFSGSQPFAFKPSESATGTELLKPSTLGDLNKTFLRLVEDRLSKDPASDLTPLNTNYLARATELATAANGNKAATLVPLNELFGKSTAGTWECSVCLVRNSNSTDTCVSCTATKPAASSSVKAASTLQPAVTSTDASKPSLAELFQAAPGEWDCSTCMVHNKADSSVCAACETPKPASTAAAAAAAGGSKSMGLSAAMSSSASSSTVTSSSFSFGPTGGFSFKPPATGGSSTSASSYAFNFGFKPSTTAVEPGGVSSTVGSGFRFNLPRTTTSTASTIVAPSFSFGLGAGAALASQGFSFKPLETASSSEARAAGGDQEDEEYVPPKVESVEHTEADAVYTVRCKLFYKKGTSWPDLGVANLFLKPCDGKTQLLIRADTSTGNILLNIFLSPDIPMSRQGTNNVSMVCVPNPPLDDTKKKTPVCMLIRVKTADMADQLLAKLTEYKDRAATAGSE